MHEPSVCSSQLPLHVTVTPGLQPHAFSTLPQLVHMCLQQALDGPQLPASPCRIRHHQTSLDSISSAGYLLSVFYWSVLLPLLSTYSPALNFLIEV